MLQTLKVLEGEARARRDRVNANQERVSIKIALNLSVWSLVAWVSHLAGSLSAAPRDYFTALRFDIICIEEREWDGCNEWDTVISTSFAQQLFSVQPLNVVIVDFPCLPARLLGDSFTHHTKVQALGSQTAPFPFPWGSFMEHPLV